MEESRNHGEVFFPAQWTERLPKTEKAGLVRTGHLNEFKRQASRTNNCLQSLASTIRGREDGAYLEAQRSSQGAAGAFRRVWPPDENTQHLPTLLSLPPSH